MRNLFSYFSTLLFNVVMIIFTFPCLQASESVAAVSQVNKQTASQKISIHVPKTIRFKSEDGLEITADLYMPHNLKTPFIILFHQAGWSRGEYAEIVPKLNQLGFNCLAVDQRSGGEINGVENQTHQQAIQAGKATNYLDAYRDMVATAKFVKSRYAEEKMIVWGSSYSAALVLKLVSEHSDIIDGVLAFAPGEYFAKAKGSSFIKKAASILQCPVFITSAKSEKSNWQAIFDAIPSKAKHNFVPESKGNHGSRALWKKFTDSKDYWSSVNNFLKKYFLQEG